MKNLSQRMYNIMDAAVDTGGAVISGFPLGFATYNFQNGYYVSALTWGSLSLAFGISVYHRIKKRESIEKLKNIMITANNESEKLSGSISKLTQMVESNPELILSHRKH